MSLALITREQAVTSAAGTWKAVGGPIRPAWEGLIPGPMRPGLPGRDGLTWNCEPSKPVLSGLVLSECFITATGNQTRTLRISSLHVCHKTVCIYTFWNNLK